MVHDHTIRPADAPRVALDMLDPATVRALTDAGYVHAADYVAMARAGGWPIAEPAPSPAKLPAPARHITVTPKVDADALAARVGLMASKARLREALERAAR